MKCATMSVATSVVAVCVMAVWVLSAPPSQAADNAPAPSNPIIASIPQPLSKADAALYRQIFAAQENGSWRRADRLIKKLSNRLLLGHVQAQRYLHRTHYRSRYPELAAWLKDYADHPDARRIYKLALSRKPRRYRAPRRPVLPKRTIYSESGNGGIVRSGQRGLRYSRTAKRLHSQVRRLVRRQRLTSAENLIKQRRFRRLGQAHVDIARMRIGSGWFYLGEDRKAFNTASKAAHRSGIYYPLGHWYAGLASYRSGRYVNAADHFQAMAATGGLSRWSQSAAAFWAARANLVARRPDRVSRWLRLAASHPRTFYGLLARRMLGIDSTLKWTAPQAQQKAITTALQSPRAQRALALLQAGNHPRAERELRYLGLGGGSDTRIALLNIADQLGLPSLALKTAIALMRQNQTRIDRGLYPVPRWEPSNGFKIDRALVYAIMRQESAFNSRARSHAGARGLMQLMPGTAGYMAQRRFRGRGRNKLYEPGLNLQLGQKYLRYLLRHDRVDGNILMMAAAYNGGPGNLSKWQRRVQKRSSDTLMFIESMPARETRDYVERVLANFWIYRDRFGQQAPTLDAIATGEPPVYISVDTP
jgi:soluble lytic murein transglycosylase